MAVLALQTALLPEVRGTSGPRDRALLNLAALLVASGLFHAVVQLVAGGPWYGPVSWRKPTTFGLAFGVTLATLVWVTRFIAVSSSARRRLLTLFGAACLLEVTVITVQAWRRVPSHFNTTTPLNAGFAYSAAAGGAVLVGVTVAFIAACRRPSPPGVAPHMALAVRAGFATFAVSLGVGVAMIVVGVRAGRTQSQAAAYSAPQALKPWHAAFMHGIFLLPAFAVLVSYLPWDERRRTRAVALAAAAYVVLAACAALLL